MSVAIGKPKTGGNRKTFKLENGDNVFRILPPMKSLAEAGKWRMYYPVQWGFKNTKGQNRPFIDPRTVNFRTKMVEVESSAYLLREKLKQRKDTLVSALKEGRASQDSVTKAVELIKQYNLDGKHYVNAVNLKGEIGLLKLNTKFKNALEAQIKEYQEKQGLHPLYMGEDGMTGLFLNFHRSNQTGNLQDWVFQVSPYLENGSDGAMRYKTHTMDAGFLGRLDAEAFDLADLYPTPSAEEVAKMVNLETLTVNPAAVDEVLGVTEKADSGLSESQPGSVSSSASGTSETEAQGTSAPAHTPDPVVTTPAVDTVAADTPVQTTASTSAPETKSDMSDDDFLKSIGAV